MKIEIEFHKDKDNNWFAIIPEYTGSHADLQMVSGADTLLDVIDLNTHKDNKVVLDLFVEKEFIQHNKEFHGHLKLINMCSDEIGGAIYVGDYLSVRIHQLWLCSVTKFIFGYMPGDIGFFVV